MFSSGSTIVGTRSLVKQTIKPHPGVSVTCLLAHADKHIFLQYTTIALYSLDPSKSNVPEIND